MILKSLALPEPFLARSWQWFYELDGETQAKANPPGKTAACLPR